MVGSFRQSAVAPTPQAVGAPRELPAERTSAAGALEVIGQTAHGAKYGMRTNQWYWIGAVPAMVFPGSYVARYYYANGVRSVSEYMRLR